METNAAFDEMEAPDFMVMNGRGGWLVYSGDERRFPVVSGFATRSAAEEWVRNREIEIMTAAGLL